MALGLAADDDEAGLLVLGLLHLLQQRLRIALKLGGSFQRFGVVVGSVRKREPYA